MRSFREIGGGMGNHMFQLAFIYAMFREGIIPDMYVQDEKYFKPYAGEICRWYGDDIEVHPVVSIHLRRGDYVNNPFYVDLSQTDYYDKAIQEFPEYDFWVFSDDEAFAKEWAAKMSEKHGKVFQVIHESELKDFNFMAGCHHNIIANSSFSWWAAYVNPNKEKKVIAPRAWHPDGVVRTGLPDNWKII